MPRWLSFLFILSLLSFVLATTHAAENDATTTITTSTTTTTTSSGTTGDGETSSSSSGANEDVLIFAFLVVLSGAVVVVYAVVRTEFHYLPESVAVVVYGIIVGVILRYIKSDVAEHLSKFDPELFFLFLLPSIIFESGFSLNKTPFFSNIGSILAFAVFGTLISFGFVGGFLYLLGKAGASYPLTLQEAMTTGALLSATDPVATLAIFQALNVDQQLYNVVFGESILNDAVALILFRASVHYDGKWLSSISIFFVVAFGSLFLGIGIALFLSAIFRVLHISRFPPLETIFMIMFSYMSYVLADALDLSGIMSVFWCGIAFNHYGAYSLSPYTTLTSRQLFRTLAFVCEMSVFLYIGISLSTTQFFFDWRLISWIVVLCLLGRAVHVFPICFILNKFKKKSKFSPQIQFAIWFAGLRGAIAFSLSLDLTTPAAPYVKTATLVFVHFTLFAMGIGTLPLLKALKIKSGQDPSLDYIQKPREKTPHERESRGAGFVKSLDEKYFKVWFRRSVPPLAREAVELFERLATTSTNESEMKPQRMMAEAAPPRKPGGYESGYIPKEKNGAILDPTEQHHTFDHLPLEIHEDEEEHDHNSPLIIQ